MQEFKLKHLLLKLFEITISYHSSGVNTLQCHFMYKNLKSFVSRCECVSCFDNIPVVNPEERFTHDGELIDNLTVKSENRGKLGFVLK